MAKKKHDVREIIIKVMAAVMAVLMVLAVAATLLYYLLH